MKSSRETYLLYKEYSFRKFLIDSEIDKILFLKILFQAKKKNR